MSGTRGNICPQPLHGTAVLDASVDLAGTQDGNTWVDTPLTVTLPEPGLYLVSGSVSTQICATVTPGSGNGTNLWTVARLVEAATGTVLVQGRGFAQHQYSPGAQTEFQHCGSGTTDLSGLIPVPAGQAPLVVRAQGGLRGNVQGGATIQNATVRPGGRLDFVKIREGI